MPTQIAKIESRYGRKAVEPDISKKGNYRERILKLVIGEAYGLALLTAAIRGLVYEAGI